jgi:hypothetical protein
MAELNPKKFGNNNQYQLRQPLPKGVPEQILAKAREFLEFLDSTKTTTHPTVRAMYHGVDLQIASLVGMVEAEKAREAGGGRDEMDVWLDNDIAGGDRR